MVNLCFLRSEICNCARTTALDCALCLLRHHRHCFVNDVRKTMRHVGRQTQELPMHAVPTRTLHTESGGHWLSRRNSWIWHGCNSRARGMPCTRKTNDKQGKILRFSVP